MSIKEIKDKFSVTREAVFLAVTVGGVLLAVINLVILNQLSPVLSDIHSLSTEVHAMELRQDRQGQTIQNLATRADVQAVSDSIGKRLDDFKTLLSLVVTIKQTQQ